MIQWELRYDIQLQAWKTVTRDWWPRRRRPGLGLLADLVPDPAPSSFRKHTRTLTHAHRQPKPLSQSLLAAGGDSNFGKWKLGILCQWHLAGKPYAGREGPTSWCPSTHPLMHNSGAPFSLTLREHNSIYKGKRLAHEAKKGKKKKRI